MPHHRPNPRQHRPAAALDPRHVTIIQPTPVAAPPTPGLLSRPVIILERTPCHRPRSTIGSPMASRLETLSCINTWVVEDEMGGVIFPSHQVVRHRVAVMLGLSRIKWEVSCAQSIGGKDHWIVNNSLDCEHMHKNTGSSSGIYGINMMASFPTKTSPNPSPSPDPGPTKCSVLPPTLKDPPVVAPGVPWDSAFPGAPVNWIMQFAPAITVLVAPMTILYVTRLGGVA
ncbi:papain-like cysteine proteinase [Hordeum vulgare]|nr:papain-like cysteine proteinase [Hordeum vulgare]